MPTSAHRMKRDRGIVQKPCGAKQSFVSWPRADYAEARLVFVVYLGGIYRTYNFCYKFCVRRVLAVDLI